MNQPLIPARTANYTYQAAPPGRAVNVGQLKPTTLATLTDEKRLLSIDDISPGEPLQLWVGPAGELSEIPLPGFNPASFPAPQAEPLQVVTVTLGIEQDVDAEELQAYMFRARFSFGAGGSTQIMECDWARGTQVSFVASSLYLDAIVSTLAVNPYTFPAGGITARLSAHVGLGSDGGITPRYSLPFATPDAGGGAFEVVAPRFARDVSVLAVTTTGVNGYTGAFDLQLLTGSLLQYSRPITTPDPVRLPGAHPVVVRVVNTGGAPGVRGLLVFGLEA